MKKISNTLLLIAIFAFPVNDLSSQALDFGPLIGLDSVLKDPDRPVLSESIDEEDESEERKQKNILDINNQRATDFNLQKEVGFYSKQRPRYSEEDLKYFGYNFFINTPINFNQDDKYGINEEYILGEGDNLKIMFFGGRNDAFTSKINRQGEIVIPELGPLKLSGVSFREAEAIIKKEISEKYFGTNAVVSLGDLRSINIFVLGEIEIPGMYQVNSLSRLTNAIFASGGIKTSGSLRGIQLKRNGRIVGTLDFYNLLLNGDTSGDLRVLPGDVVFIPPRINSIAVDGEVQRPGVYELKENETLNDLLLYSGNLKPTANTRNVEIQRIEKDKNSFELINLDIESSQNKIVLKNGDLLLFHPIKNIVKGAIRKSGHTSEPGLHPWTPTTRVSDIIEDKFELLKGTDLSYLLVKRQGGVTQGFDYLQVNIANVLDNSDSDENIELHDRDELIFFPRVLEAKDITTKLIQDTYDFDEYNNLVIDEERTGLEFFRKSLLDSQNRLNKESGKNTYIPSSENLEDSDNKVENRYYEYRIYDYCSVSNNLAKDIIESMGFLEKNSISLDELESLSTPEDVQLIVTQVEKEKAKNEASDISDSNVQISDRLTKTCRNQLLQPVLASMNKQVFIDNKEMTVDIFGNVHFPGKYPFTDNMTLHDAIEAAGGLRESSFRSEVEINSSRYDDKMVLSKNFYANIEGSVTNIVKIKPLDIINVKQIFKETKKVELTGEVYFPGTYPVSEGETLSDLINRAGGIKPKGSMEAANFRRKELAEVQMERMVKAKTELKRKILFSTESFANNEGSALQTDFESIGKLIDSTAEQDVELMGRLVIDLDSIINGTREDIILEDGDRLHIPKQRQTITVVGEVYVENSHIYQSGLSLDDYINLSGGGTSLSDLTSTYIVKSDGRIVLPSEAGGFFRMAKTISPGDTIVVPMDATPFDTLKAATEITQIIYQMGLAAAAINSL